MNKEIETINIEPSTNLIDVIATEYTFNSAVADLVDNCIDGKATKIRILFEKRGDEYDLHIIDNGTGMSKDSLKEAAVIGLKSSDDYRSTNALGRYSTGLKSAANYLARSAIVVSKTKLSERNILRIDFEKLKKEKSWVAQFLDSYEKESEIKTQGTLVSCVGLKNSNSSNFLETVDHLKTHLNHVFGKYLISKKLEIVLSTSLSKDINLIGWNPFYVPGNTSTKKILDKEVYFMDKKIVFRVYIMPNYSLLSQEDRDYMSGGDGSFNVNKLAGFYVYRNDRLISEAGWLLDEFDINDKSRYARIEVQIPSTLDKYFKVNLTKTKIEVPNELVPTFRSIGQKARTESNKKNYLTKDLTLKKKPGKVKDTIWTIVKSSNGVSFKINQESSYLKDLCKNLSKNDFKKLLSVIEKSIPISALTSQTINQKSFSECELKQMAKEEYKELLLKGLSKDEIHRKMAEMDPFSDNIDLLANVFEELEEGEKND